MRHAVGAGCADDDLGELRSRVASTTSSTSSRGTSARRIAVHFWPALTVISVTSCLTNSSNSGVSGVGVGAEHRAVERVGLGVEPDRVGHHRRGAAQLAGGGRRAGEEDEVLAAERGRARRAALPASSCTEPSGQQPASRRSAGTTASVRYAVWLAGFTIVGTPARNAGASFSRKPHTGKLKALICTATPRSGVQRCWPAKVPRLPSGSTAPSRTTVSSGSSRSALARVGEHGAEAAVDVDGAVPVGGAGAVRERVELVLVGHQPQAELLEQRRRAGGTSARAAPDRRRCGRGRASPARRGRCC